MHEKILAVSLVALTFLGCNSESEKAATGKLDRSPLTAEQWEAIPSEEKFDAAILERLRSSDVKFEDDEVWNAFMDDVVAPAIKKAAGPSAGKAKLKSSDPAFFREG
jgi:uncharacterized lipoprotein NlpE involved in copper resistance